MAPTAGKQNQTRCLPWVLMKSESEGEAHRVEPGRVNGVLRNSTEENKRTCVGEKMVVRRRRQAQKQPPEQKQWESDRAWTWWWALAIQTQKAEAGEPRV